MSKTIKIIPTKKAAAKPKTSEDVNEKDFSGLIVVFFGGPLKPAFFHVVKLEKKRSSTDVTAAEYISKFIKNEKEGMTKSLCPCGYMFSVVKGDSNLDDKFEEFVNETGKNVTGSIFRSVTKEAIKSSLTRIFQTQPAIVDDESVTTKKSSTKKREISEDDEEERKVPEKKVKVTKKKEKESDDEPVAPKKSSKHKSKVERDEDEEDEEKPKKLSKKPTKNAPSDEEDEEEEEKPKKLSKKPTKSTPSEDDDRSRRNNKRRRDSSESGINTPSRSLSAASSSKKSTTKR